MRREGRPYVVLGAALLVLAAGFLVPATRAFLLDSLVDPLQAQADPRSGHSAGYSLPSLMLWALLGLALGWAAYALVFGTLRYEPDRRFFLALAPYLLAGPLAHALLAVRAFPAGSPIAYLAAEPLVYLTIALVAAAGLALGHVTRRRLAAPLALGALVLAPLLVMAAPRVQAAAWPQLGAILLLAFAPAGALAYAFVKWRSGEPLDAVAAVIGAHALDGATTWMVLRDPFGLGFDTYAEKNPVSEQLVNMANGWPYFALKLALPLVLLTLVKPEDGDARTRSFLLFAVFVLGYGPGMANLLQVLLG